MSKAFTNVNKDSIESLSLATSSSSIILKYVRKITSVFFFSMILFITYQSNACTVTGVVTNVSCNGGNNGAINVSVSGGSSPFHWLWNNGSTSEDRTNLTAGTYTVTVTDNNGSTGSASFTVTQPTALSVTAVLTNVTTNGGNNGAIDQSVSGGSSPYTYLWNSGATSQDRTSLTAGTYTVTVKDNHNCSTVKTYTITQPTCNGVINDVIIYNLTNGTTFDVINDNDSYTLGSLPSSWNVEAHVSGSTAESVQFIFSGSSTQTNIENTTPFRSPTDAVALNLGVGSYTLVVKLFSADNAGGSMCAQTTLHFTITPNCNLGLTATSANVSCYGGTNGSIDVSVSGAQGTVTYLWNNGATTQDRSGLAAGTYTVTATDGGCSNCTATLTKTITQPTALSVTGVVTNVTTIGGNNGAIDQTVTGGTSPYTYLWNGGATTQDRTGLTAGTYTVTVTDNHNCTTVKTYTITQPTCNAVINSVIIYNLVNGTTFDVIQDNDTYTLGSLPSSWNIEALVSGTTAESVQFTFSGGSTQTNIENTVPFRSPTDAVALNLGVGSYTLVVKLFSADNAGGSMCAQTTLHFTITPSCLITVDITPDQGICSQLPAVITATVHDTSICTTTNSDCNHSLANSGGFLENSTASTICGDNTGTKLWTQSGQGTSFITLDFGVVVPAGTIICANMKLEHCTNSSTTYSNAQISSSLSSSSGFSTVVSSVTFSQSTFQEFCYTLANSARYIKIVDNGNCAFRVDYVEYTTTINSGSVTYQWTGPGIVGPSNHASITVNTPGSYVVVVTDCQGCSATDTYNQPGAIELSAVTTNVICNGGTNGSIDVTVAGGTPPYTYLWNDGAITQDRSGLSAGTYTVTVTDVNSCSATLTKTITQPSLLSLSGTKIDVSITGGNNGSINVTTTGGTPPYHYLWNDGATTEDRTGLTAGTYTVTVTDDHGCTASGAFTLTQPPCNLSLTATTTNITCHGNANGSINVTATGAQGTVTYLWNDGATTEDRTGLAPGTYTVTATDGGNCSYTLTKTITEPDELGVNGTVLDVSITGGNDGSIDVTVTGGTPPYTYLWNDGATTEDRTGLTAGTYIVTVTDYNGCTKQKTFIVHQPPCNLSLDATTVHVLCHGNANGSIDVTTTGAQGTVTYLWNDGATTEDRTGLTAGTYTVTATDAGNCTATLAKTITEPDELVVNGTVLNVTINGGSDGSIDVTVTGGTPPYTYLWNDGATTEDRTGLTAGTYIITVADINGCTQQHTFIVTQPDCVCVPPTNLTIDSISSTQANLCWDSVACATGYRIRWRTEPKLKWLYRTVTAPAHCAIFTNQYPAVYDIQIATLCSNGDSSAYGAMFIFHTYPSCLPPGGMNTTNITSTKATVHWNTVIDAGSYSVSYRPVGNISFTTKTSNTTSLALKNLVPNTTYEWKVASKCGSGGYAVTGLYSGLSTFTTAVLRVSEESYTAAAFTVYPNPASSNFNVDFDLGVESSDDYLLVISNTLGQVVYSEKSKLENGRLSERILAGEIFADGLYSVSVLVNGQQFNQTMVITKQ